MNVRVKITGLPQLSSRSALARNVARKSLGGAIYREGERVMGRSKEEFVPVAKGNLKSSGQVYPPEWTGNLVTVILGYGDEAVDYALIVHEDLQARHPTGQAKYLERPVMEAQAGMSERLAADAGLQFRSEMGS